MDLSKRQPLFPKPILGVLFDFDGTLTQPGAVDFLQVRQELNCPPDQPILEYLQSLSDARMKAALDRLDQLEFEGALRSKPNQGSMEVIRFLKNRKIPFSLLSRNSYRSIVKALESFPFLQKKDFSVLVSRDDPLPPKPDPAPVHFIAGKMGVPVDQLLTIGDYIYDIEAGRLAGSPTIHLTNYRTDLDCPADHTIHELTELIPVLDHYTPLPIGKLPNRLLEPVLHQLGQDPEKVIISPGIGEDVGVVRLPEEKALLVLKSDPITFATESLAEYALNVNANDIVCSGAIPQWFLATLLAPAGTTAWEIISLIETTGTIASEMGIHLLGGHTEITDSVNRMVLCGHMVGFVKREELIDKSDVGEGDGVLLTKAIAVEGTSILAREKEDFLVKKGVRREVIRKGQRMIEKPGISIVPEARIASKISAVAALHDITEGGIATAVEELSAATGHRIGIQPSRIPLYPETQEICSALGLDPLGLIGSGSLLIVVRDLSIDDLIKQLQSARIQVSRIGTVLEPGVGVQSLETDQDWPSFQRDEIARVFEDTEKTAVDSQTD